MKENNSMVEYSFIVLCSSYDGLDLNLIINLVDTFFSMWIQTHYVVYYNDAV